MVCISVLYTLTPGESFDHDYYAHHHMPMVLQKLETFGMVRYEIDKGLAGGAPGSEAPFAAIGRLYFDTVEEFQKGMDAHGAEIIKDVPHYTGIQPQFLVSEVSAS
jgi:uncharacterized protein (TIGR02118 family)